MQPGFAKPPTAPQLLESNGVERTNWAVAESCVFIRAECEPVGANPPSGGHGIEVKLLITLPVLMYAEA